MTNVLRLVVAISLVSQISGCHLSMERMRDLFEEEVRSTVGHTLGDLQQPDHFLGARHPTNVARSEGGDLLYVYGRFWDGYSMRSETEPCVVTLEISSTTNRVIRASAEGNGCYTAY